MPEQQPTLTSPRLILRPMTPDDVPALTRIAGEWRIADVTASIPHPFTEELSRAMIERFGTEWREGTGAHFAIATKENPNGLIGYVLLKNIDSANAAGELGFLMDAAECGKGYVTEAARRVMEFGFETLSLNRIYANHMVRNPASGRVLEKIGMREEGHLRQRVRKWGVFEDVALWSRLCSDAELPSQHRFDSLTAVRAEIDRLDRQIVALIGHRAHCVKEAARFKKNEQEVAAPERLAAMLKDRRAWAESVNVDPEVIEKLYRDLVAHFIEIEKAKLAS